MAEKNSAEQKTQPSRTLGQRAKQAGLFVLFGTILIIPRIRRLRRKVWLWTVIRIIAVTCGGWLVWRYAHLRSGRTALAGGLVLVILGALLRSKPLVKSVDAVANELGALIALNGGAFRSTPKSPKVRNTQIFVHPAKLIVHGPRASLLAEIPVGKIRGLATRPSADGGEKAFPPWEVEIEWLADGQHTSTFLYEGPFAEHLAQVTESTLRSQWKKELPIVPQ